MTQLTYVSHETLRAIPVRDYMTAAQLLVFVEQVGLDHPAARGTLTEADLSPLLGEVLGDGIDGAYRAYWRHLGLWQKYRIPKFCSDEELALLQAARTLTVPRVQDSLPESAVFYALEQYARYELFYLEQRGAPLTEQLATKFSLDLVPYRTRFTVTSDEDNFNFPALRQATLDLLDYTADYFEWDDYAGSLRELTRSPYSPGLHNSVLYPYSMYRIPDRQLYLTLTPTAPRWLGHDDGLWEDTYRFDDTNQTISRVVQGKPVPLTEYTLSLGTHDHLLDQRADPMSEYTEYLLDALRE